MKSSKRVGIGVIGAGFIADTRARCYGMVAGYDAQVVAVAARSEASAKAYAERHAVPDWSTGFEDVLANPAVDMVDLCVPNILHRSMCEAAAAAGKHVVCTKPLTAYVGQDLGGEPSDAEISGQDRASMERVAVEDAEAMVAACAKAGVQLMYGENWVYAPAIARAIQLMESAGGTILDMRGGESHNGSHSPYSKTWRYTGGGALLRLGAHPIGAMIHAKRREGLARDGQAITPVSVSAEVSDLSRIPSVQKETDAWIVKGWKDVENWGTAIIGFSDGSRGVAWGADTMLGGMESVLEFSMTNARFKCNLSPNDMLEAYAPDGQVFGEEYLMEKISTKAGWVSAMPNEDWTSGQFQMCQDFVAAVAEGRPALSDGGLGCDVVRVVYAAYRAAAEGSRIELR